jgi:hypothetical protein
MAFGLKRTFTQPASGVNAQRGFPSPGVGQTHYTQGYPVDLSLADGGDSSPPQPITPVNPTIGIRSFLNIFSRSGMPSPENGLQARPPGSWATNLRSLGQPFYVHTRGFSRGANAYVPNFGKVLTNPIGAGIVALSRPQASYGPSGRYENAAIWWVSQDIPTTIGLQGLTDPNTLSALLGQVSVQAVYPTTG